MTVAGRERGSPRRQEGEHPLERGRPTERERFLAIVQAHDRGLRALAYRLLGDPDEMDDVLQEAYLRAYRNLSGFRGESQLGTWLYRITYNACMDRLRRSTRDVPTDPTELSERHGHAPTGDDPAESAASRADLARALAGLPPEARAAVLLVDAQGYDYATAAEILDIPTGTLASRLHHARDVLRRALDGDTRPSAARREDR